MAGKRGLKSGLTEVREEPEINLSYTAPYRVSQLENDLDFQTKNEVENVMRASAKIYSPNLTMSGDLSVIQFRGEDGEIKNVIVDFGNYSDDYYSNLVQKMIAKGITKFHYAVISHYHNDHIGSLTAMLNDSTFDFSDCEFYLPPSPNWSSWVGSHSSIQQNESNVKAALTNAGIDFIMASNEIEVNINDCSKINFYNAVPADFSSYYSVLHNGATDYNNFSLVAQFSFYGQTILFTGDLGSQGQRVVMAQGLQAPSVIKAPHHGQGAYRTNDSAAGMDAEFVGKIIKPRIIFITGLVATSWLWDALSKIYNTYRTATNGDIEIRMRNDGISAWCENGGGFDPGSSTQGLLSALSLDGILNLGDMLTNNRLLENDDLDTFVTEGTYGSASTSITETLQNAPSGIAGRIKLIVFVTSNNGRVIQIIAQDNSPYMFIRRGRHQDDVNSWKSWFKICIDGQGENITSDSDLDLNNYAQGVYYCSDGEVAATLIHAPSELDFTFKLVVEKTIADDRIVQTIISNTRILRIYKRVYSLEGWGAWYRLDSTAVEERESTTI